MSYSEAQKRASRKYNEAKYDRIGIYLSKESGRKKEWQAAAQEMGISVAELIIQAVEEYIKNNAQTTPEEPEQVQ